MTVRGSDWLTESVWAFIKMRGPVRFFEIDADMEARFGLGFRKTDRAIQKLRKAGRIEQKKPGLWVVKSQQ